MGFEPNRLQAGLAAGDPGAYEAAYDRYAGQLYRAAVRILGDATAAEDAVQDVFVSVVRSRERIGAVENLAAYLFVSLRRAAGRIHQRQQSRPTTDLDDVSPAAVETAPACEHDTDVLDRAVRRLPDAQREVLAMKIDGGLTFAEIGDVLEISASTAASRYRYALTKLRDVMED